MLDYASLFDPRSENDDDAFTLTRPDRRWDALRADWKEGTEWPDLFGPHDPFTLTDGVGQGATNRRADVAKVETLLGAAGYHDLDRTEGPTGYWGETLKQSIRRFQKDRDLEVDGYLRPKGETIASLKGLLGSPAKPENRSAAAPVDESSLLDWTKAGIRPWVDSVLEHRQAHDGLVGWLDWGLGHDDAKTRALFTTFLDGVGERDGAFAQTLRDGLAQRRNGPDADGRRLGDSFVYYPGRGQTEYQTMELPPEDRLPHPNMPTVYIPGKTWDPYTGTWRNMTLEERSNHYQLMADNSGGSAPPAGAEQPAPPPSQGNPDATPKPNPGAGSKPLPPMPPVVGLDADVSTRPQLPPEAALYGGSNQAPSPDRFESFFRQLQDIEREYSNKPNDRGGETNHGVKLDTFNKYLKEGEHRHEMPSDIKDLTKEQAKTIIREFFYDPLKIDQIRDEQTARHLFDAAVHSGNPQATKWIQRELANKIGSNITDDGVMGSYTRQILNALLPSELAAVNAGMAEERIKLMNKIVEKEPEKAKYYKHWTERARSFGAWRPLP